MDNVQTANPYAEQIETEIMCLAVSEAVSAMLTATHLSEHEVLAILEHISVKSLGEVEGAVRMLQNLDSVRRAGAPHLGAVIKGAISDIAGLAEIDPDDLVRILTGHHGGTVADIVRSLRAGGSVSDVSGRPQFIDYGQG
ncbi:MAG TPA: hypothetical protein VFM10_08000 [Terriglobales bacterium]|nr:hypothetical protein [Terriglobales bacterium]